jgi:hypothetical protein
LAKNERKMGENERKWAKMGENGRKIGFALGINAKNGRNCAKNDIKKGENGQKMI